MKIYEIPRGQLVKKSMDYPHLIDAGFVKFNQQFESMEDELSNQTILTERMPFDDQMKYKAILDIDGNNWSSRFPKLLCTNSVVIKVRVNSFSLFVFIYQTSLPMCLIFVAANPAISWNTTAACFFFLHQIDPDFIEHFYHELTPMVHYIPASLKNVTEVVSYVLDEKNEQQMKQIIHSSNMWCRRKMTANAMAKDMMVQIEKYQAAIVNDLGISVEVQNELVSTFLSKNVTKELDLVQCL